MYLTIALQIEKLRHSWFIKEGDKIIRIKSFPICTQTY